MKIVIFSIFLCLMNPFHIWSFDFDGWKTISTEHFTYIFEEFDKNTAFELADSGEEIYDKVTEFFDFRPGHIKVYINSRVDSPNGNFYPIPGSIDLFPVYPLNSENTTSGKSWLYELFLHEMVHYVNLEKPAGLFGGLSYIFGKDLASANGAFLPAWMVEGIAVYLETEMTDGGRGRNRYFEAFMKAAAYEKSYPTLNQLAYSSSFPPYNRIYSGGYALIDYMIRHFGDDIFNRIYAGYVKFPLFGPFAAIKKTTGLSAEDIYIAMKAELEGKYSLFFSSSEQYESEDLASEEISDRTHPIPTERGILYYSEGQKSPPAIVSLDRKTGEETVVVETRLIESSSFSSDSAGNNLVFASGDYGLYNSYGLRITSKLFILAGGKTRLLTDEASLFQPAVSPDGSKIVAVKRNGSYSTLVEIDKTTGAVKEIYGEEGTNIMNPRFSPDNLELVFVRNRKGMQDVYLMKLDEPATAGPLFGNDSFMDYFPSFTDKGEISFVSDRDGELALYLFDRATGSLERAFRDPVAVSDGFVSGDSLVYQTYRTDGYRVRRGILKKEIMPPIVKSDQPVDPIPVPAAQEHRLKGYFDAAIPYVWLPKPYLLNSTSEGLLWGAGAALYGGSVTQSTTWLIDINVLPLPGQLEGSFSYRRKIGSTALEYSLNQSFFEQHVPGGYRWNQQTDQSLLFSYPLVEKSFVTWRHVLLNYFYMRHVLQFSDDGLFSLADASGLDGGSYLYGGTGLTLNDYRINRSTSALFGGFSLFNQGSFSFLLPLFSSSSFVWLAKETGSLTIPLSSRGNNLVMAWEGAYHSGGVSSSAVNARGWVPELMESDVSFYYSTGIQLPLALLDWGLPLGFNIQNLAVTANFEGISHFLFAGGNFNEFYGDFELIGTYGYNYGSIPFGAGINVKFYPERDWRIYFFFSFDSLRG